MVPVTPGFKDFVAPDAPTEPGQLCGVVEDAEKYERDYGEGELICADTASRPSQVGRDSLADDGADLGLELADEEEDADEHYYGPRSFERQRHPYSDFGYPFEPSAARAKAEAEARAVELESEEKEEEAALIAAIMEQRDEDKPDHTVTTSTFFFRSILRWSVAVPTMHTST